MSYSEDLKSQAIEYVKSGGVRKEACKIFGITRQTLWRWENGIKQGAEGSSIRRGKVDKGALRAHVEE